MSFWKTLFGRKTPTIIHGSPASEKAIGSFHEPAPTAKPSDIASPPSSRDYFNKEWNFGLTIPADWKIEFENRDGDPGAPEWMQPLRISCAKANHGHPYLSILARPTKEDGKGVRGYMDKAESDLRRGFYGFALDAKRETELLGYPVAWMTYGYRLDSGPRKEINATAFFGHGMMLAFQFIGETDADRVDTNFPLFERIIRSLRVGPSGIRHPSVYLPESRVCELCQKAFPERTAHSMLNLKLGRFIAVCASCRNSETSI